MRLELPIIDSHDLPTWSEASQGQCAQTTEAGNGDAFAAQRNLLRIGLPTGIAAEGYTVVEGRRSAFFGWIQYSGSGLRLIG